MHRLLDNAEILELLAAKQRTAATYNGSAIDVNGKAEKVVAVISVGNVATDGTLDVAIQECAESTFADPTVLQTCTQIIAAGKASYEVKPTLRYVRAVGVVETAAVDFGVVGIFANMRDTINPPAAAA